MQKCSKCLKTKNRVIIYIVRVGSTFVENGVNQIIIPWHENILFDVQDEFVICFPPYWSNINKCFWQNFNKGTKIHTIEIWNIDSKKYPEILSSEYFGILIPNSNWGTKLSHISDSVYSREEYHTCLMQILFNVNPNPYFSFYLSSFVNINISCYIEISISCCETNWTIN